MDLVERVLADERQVVVVTAPAGYGKSTFLRQWAEREERSVAWVSLEATDDDESVLVDYIASALERAGVHGGPPDRARPHRHAWRAPDGATDPARGGLVGLVADRSCS